MPAAYCRQGITKMVGARGFEPPTPCSQGRCANRAALRPDFKANCTTFIIGNGRSCVNTGLRLVPLDSPRSQCYFQVWLLGFSFLETIVAPLAQLVEQLTLNQ